MQTPNLRDFYQKALVPIGTNDKIALLEGGSQNWIASTHWLIVLEGDQLPQPKEYFYWKVCIYPSNSDGSFEWLKPIYATKSMESMDEALAIARLLETCSKNDQFFTSTFQEKIS